VDYEKGFQCSVYQKPTLISLMLVAYVNYLFTELIINEDTKNINLTKGMYIRMFKLKKYIQDKYLEHRILF